ncbi:hypothetical protein C8R45DRAFT_54256 [Mycena sanguinolenta]|nr:hypothetical protein C8R45DRAFT_54256 [Mycena sanguinolenta]
MFRLPANQCFISGIEMEDSTGIEMMHVVPLEIGSAVVSRLMTLVHERCDAVHNAYRDLDDFNYVPDPENPIICDAKLFSSNAKWVGPPLTQRTINLAFNIRPVSAFLHRVNDLGSGLLISTKPKLWLNREHNIYTVGPIYRQLQQHDFTSLPTTTTVRTSNDKSAYLLASFADAATIYERFATQHLRSQAQSIFQRLKSCLAVSKQEDDDFAPDHQDDVKKVDQSTPSSIILGPGLAHLRNLFTSPDDLVYEDSESESVDEELKLAPTSKDVLVSLFRVTDPGADEEKRLEHLHEQVKIYFMMLANWQAGA